MHTFAIISNSAKKRLEKRKTILKDFQIDRFGQIILDRNSGTISAVKETQRLLSLQSLGKNQALIIEEIQSLSQPAQQALLKLLEEPPKNTVIILEATNQEQILETIISRAAIFYIPAQEELSTEMQKNITDFWADLFRNDSIGKRLLKSSETVTVNNDRDSNINWINQQIIYFHDLLEKRVKQKNWKKTNLSPLNIGQIIRLLIFSKKYLLLNVNIKLLLDNLFLNLPYLCAKTDN